MTHFDLELHKVIRARDAQGQPNADGSCDLCGEHWPGGSDVFAQGLCAVEDAHLRQLTLFIEHRPMW